MSKVKFLELHFYANKTKNTPRLPITQETQQYYDELYNIQSQ